MRLRQSVFLYSSDATIDETIIVNLLTEIENTLQTHVIKKRRLPRSERVVVKIMLLAFTPCVK